MADKRESGGASSSKRVSWAPLPMLQGEAAEQDKARAEVGCCLHHSCQHILLGFAKLAVLCCESHSLL